MTKQLCPICRKTGTCRQAPNGKSGYCKTHKKRWKLERVPTTELGKMQPGQIQHEDLIPFEEDLMRWSYRIVGHYVQDTLEQWELGDQFSNVLTFRRRRFGFVQHAVPHSSQRRLFGVLTRPERFRRKKISSPKRTLNLDPLVNTRLRGVFKKQPKQAVFAKVPVFTSGEAFFVIPRRGLHGTDMALSGSPGLIRGCLLPARARRAGGASTRSPGLDVTGRHALLQGLQQWQDDAGRLGRLGHAPVQLGPDEGPQLLSGLIRVGRPVQAATG